MSTSTQRPTPETQAFHSTVKGTPLEKYWSAIGKCEQFERERDEALSKLSTVYRWIERHHPDGFIDSQSHFQNLDRVADAWHDKLQAMREAIKNANHFASIILAEAGKQWLATEPLPDVASIEAVAQQIKDELQPLLKP